MRVVALVAWSNGAITMEEKGVYEVEDDLATGLIAQGLCADAATYFGGGSTDEALYITYNEANNSYNSTWDEIRAAVGTGFDSKPIYIRMKNQDDVYTPFVQASVTKSGIPAVLYNVYIYTSYDKLQQSDKIKHTLARILIESTGAQIEKKESTFDVDA